MIWSQKRARLFLQFAAVAGSSYVLLYVWNWRRKNGVTVTVGRSTRLGSIVDQVTALKSAYRPPLLLSSGVLHTLMVPMRQTVNPKLVRETLNAPCGGRIALDWWVDREAKDDSECKDPSIPTVIILPGVGGSSRATYVSSAGRSLREAGFQVCVLNHRGSPGTEITSPVLYSAVFDADLEMVVQELHESRGFSDLFVVGYSLGSVITAKYCARMGSNNILKGACAVSNPLDLESGANRMPWLMDWAVLQGLLKLVERYRRLYPNAPGMDFKGKVKSTREFDEAYTCKLHDFENASHYYSHGNIRNFLPSIEVPFLLFVAKDDPLVDPKLLPVDLVRASSTVIMAVTDAGGHIGWFEGGWLLPQLHKNRMDDVVTQFLGAVKVRA